MATCCCWFSILFLVLATMNIIHESFTLHLDSALDREHKFGEDSQQYGHDSRDSEDPEPVKLIVVNGEQMQLIDDMILPLDFLQLNSTTKSGIDDESRRWPDATIVYEISDDFKLPAAVGYGALRYNFVNNFALNDEEKAEIFQGMKKISSVTCLTFRERRPEEMAYVAVQQADDDNQPGGCSSHVGRSGKRQLLLLQRQRCLEAGIVSHEFMHAAGFHHEQSRPDRNDYVVINWANILKKHRHNFFKYDDSLTFGVPYDFSSVMHYSRTAFAIDESVATIQRKDCPTCVLGQRKALTDYDILKLQRMYKCPSNSSSSPSE